MESISSGTTQFLTFLLAAATLHGIWLGILLVMKAPRRAARLLAVCFFLLSLYLINYILFLTGAIRAVPHLFGVFYPLLFLIGPCFYFFIKLSMSPSTSFKRYLLWHLIFVGIALFNTLDLYALPAEQKLQLIDAILSMQLDYTWKNILIGSGFLIHLGIYVAGAWQLSKQLEKLELDQKSRMSIGWYRQFCQLFLLIIILDLAIRYSCFALRIPGPAIEMMIAWLLAIAIQLAGYRVIGKLGNFPWVSNIKEAVNGKYKTSPLTAKQMKRYREALLELMNTEQPYLNASLKISDLAKKMEIPSHYLSQVLNEGMSTNFYDFVNTYRINLAKQRLKDEKYQHYSFLAIGMECGFTNKTTFNRTFKKIVGMTPSAYVNSDSISQ